MPICHADLSCRAISRCSSRPYRNPDGLDLVDSNKPVMMIMSKEEAKNGFMCDGKMMYGKKPKGTKW